MDMEQRFKKTSDFTSAILTTEPCTMYSKQQSVRIFVSQKLTLHAVQLTLTYPGLVVSLLWTPLPHSNLHIMQVPVLTTTKETVRMCKRQPTKRSFLKNMTDY